MTFKFGNMVANIESLDAQNAITSAEGDVEAQDTATDVAEMASDADAVQSEINTTDAAIASAEEGEDKVEELTAVAEETLAGEGEKVPEGELGQEGDGLEEGESALIEVTHESIMKSLGMSHSRITLTTESFGSTASRRQATIDTLESLKETASKIGNGIIAALKAALNTVVNFLTGLVRNRALMEKHLVNLQAKVKAIDPSLKPRAATISNGASALSVDGKASPETALRLLADGQKLVSYAVSVSDAMSNGYEFTLKAVQATPAGVAVAGNRTLKVEASENGATIELAAAGEGAKEIAAPSAAQMQSILQAAIQTLQKLREFEKTQNKLKSAVTSIIARLSEAYSATRAKVAEKMTKNVDSFIKHGVDAEIKKDARLARGLLSKVGGSIPGAVFQAVKGAADYVTGGLNNYKTEKAAAPAAAA